MARKYNVLTKCHNGRCPTEVYWTRAKTSRKAAKRCKTCGSERTEKIDDRVAR